MKSLPPPAFLSKTPARTKRGVLLKPPCPLSFLMVDFQGYGDLLRRLIWTCRDHPEILWYQSALQQDKDQLLPAGLLMHPGCSCLQERERGWGQAETTPACRCRPGFPPTFPSPFWLLPRLSIANCVLLSSSPAPLCVAQDKLAVPSPLRHRSFPSLPPVWTAFPTRATPLQERCARSSAGKAGGHSTTRILALTSDTATVGGRARQKTCTSPWRHHCLEIFSEGKSGLFPFNKEKRETHHTCLCSLWIQTVSRIS